jgi:hypothetical protein
VSDDWVGSEAGRVCGDMEGLFIWRGKKIGMKPVNTCRRFDEYIDQPYIHITIYMYKHKQNKRKREKKIPPPIYTYTYIHTYIHNQK